MPWRIVNLSGSDPRMGRICDDTDKVRRSMVIRKSGNWYSARDVSTTFVKGLRVMAAFETAQSRLTLPDIGEATGYDRAAVRRLVATLVDEGYVEKLGRHFSLTPGVLAFAGSYLRSHGVGTLVQPILDRCSQELDRQVSFAHLSGDMVIYVAQSSNKDAVVSFGFTVGSRLPVLHTALGRALLAHEDPELAERMINTITITRYCAGTQMDRGAILRQVEVIRKAGFAVVSNEFENGISGLAVPVGHMGAHKGVIGTSGPTGEILNSKIQETCVTALQKCARDIDRSSISIP